VAARESMVRKVCETGRPKFYTGSEREREGVMYVLMWPWLGPPLTTIRYVLPVSWTTSCAYITGQAMAMSIGCIQIMLSKTIIVKCF